VPKIDSQTAFVVALTGLAFLFVSAWVPGIVIIALGLAAGSIGYRAAP